LIELSIFFMATACSWSAGQDEVTGHSKSASVVAAAGPGCSPERRALADRAQHDLHAFVHITSFRLFIGSCCDGVQVLKAWQLSCKLLLWLLAGLCCRSEQLQPKLVYKPAALDGTCVGVCCAMQVVTSCCRNPEFVEEAGSGPVPCNRNFEREQFQQQLPKGRCFAYQQDEWKHWMEQADGYIGQTTQSWLLTTSRHVGCGEKRPYML